MQSTWGEQPLAGYFIGRVKLDAGIEWILLNNPLREEDGCPRSIL